MVKFYLVGGYVRDKILGVKSNDIDFAVEASSYDEMKEAILARGGMLFLEKPEYFTIRGLLPEYGPCDFVLCRKDGSYYDGRRPESVEVGSIEDDLARRDFTMNAIAIDENGHYIDPFNGKKDLKNKTIVCVGNTYIRFSEDYLRILRALRFYVVKRMILSYPIVDCLHDVDMVQHLREVSIERVREELHKMFKSDVEAALTALYRFPLVRVNVFTQGLWLEPTLKGN